MFLKSGRIVTFLFLLGFLVGVVSPAFSFSLSGNWSYRQNGGDEQETQSVFQQNYQLGVGPSLTLQPTRAITLSGGVGYRNTQRNSGNGKGFETVEQVSPYAQMSLINDIFVATASANTFITLAGSESSSSFWNASLGSAWSETYWPNISFNYGEDFDSLSGASLFDASGGKNQNTSVSVTWDIFLADLYYEYNLSERINGGGDSQSQSNTHYVNLETGGDIWGNRIGYNLSQQFRQVTTDVTVGEDFDPLEDLGAVRGQAFFYTETVLSGFDENAEVVSIDLEAKNTDLLGLLNNNDVTEDSSLQVAGDSLGYFGFRSDFTEQVATISLYLDPGSQIPTEAQLAQLQWTLFRKIPNSLGNDWERVQILQPGFVEATRLGQEIWRFIFNVNLSDDEFMVRLNNPAGNVLLSFNELDVSRSVVSADNNFTTSTSSTTSYKTNFSVRYRIVQSLGTSFNINYEHSESENESLLVNENDKISWSGRLNWSPSPYFSPSLGYSEYLEIRTGQEDYRNVAYSLATSSRLLPSLNLSFALTHNEQFKGNQKTDISSIFSLNSQIRIYPDLTLSLSSSYADSDRLVTDITDDRSFVVNTKTISSRADIVARLTRKLVTYVSTTHSTTDSETDGTRESADTSIRFSYRPSDLLSLQSSYTMFFGDTDRDNSLDNSIDLYLLRTYKARLSLSATHVQTDEDLFGVRLLGSWDISDFFSLSTVGNYSMGPINNYSFNVNLAMRL